MKKRTVIAFALAAALVIAPVSGNITTMTVSAAGEENAQKVKDGSFAYFQDKGAADALDALNNSTYANLTVKGDAADATSFKNMLQTLQWIRECNRLRAANGLDPLLVNDEMMAMAQADANYSDTVIGHAKQFGVGENCAWNFGSNPFTQWYDEEKAVYDAMENPEWTNQTGHYLNIINPSYKITGFAINTRGTNYPYTYVQVFSGSGDGVTVDEYEKQLLEYYNSINSGNSSSSDNNGTTSDNESNNSGDDSSASQPGKTETKSSAVAAMTRVNNSIRTKIELAAAEAEAAGIGVGDVVIDGREYDINTFHISTMKALNEANVNAVLKYDYEGNHYEIMIPAGEAPVYDEIVWYGPMYLYGNFIGTAVVTPIE